MRKGPYRETRSVMQVSTRRGGRHFAGRGVAGWCKMAFAIVLTAAMVLQSSNIQAMAGELLDPAGAGQVAGGEVEQQVADESVAEGLTEADGADETDAATETDATVETDGEQTAAGDVTEGDDAVADGIAAEGEPSEDVAAEPVDETVTEESTTPETQAETVASESASANGAEGRTISGSKSVPAGQSIELKTDENDRGDFWHGEYEHRWTVADSSIATTENGNRFGCTVKGVSAGNTTVTHEWGYYEYEGWWLFGEYIWRRVGVETYTVTVTSPVSEGNYPVYIYTLVPGVEIDDSRSNDEKWNGMGVGFISDDAVDAPASYGDNFTFGSIPEGVNYASPNFPKITVDGRKYTYAAPGSENEYKEGYYRIEWIRMVTAGGANAGANSYNPVVDSDTITFHLDGRILPNKTDQFNVSFYVREAGGNEFVLQEEYVRFLSKGTRLSEIEQPNPDKEVTLPNGAKYTLDAWYTDEACTKEATFEGTLEADVAYYARYVPAASQTYTVTYEAGTGGDVLPAGQQDQVLECDDITGSTATADDGYKFEGWYKVNADGTEARIEGATNTLGADLVRNNLNGADGVYSDTTFKAKFVADETQNYDVFYTTDGNGTADPTVNEDVQVLGTDGVTGSTATANPGYKFDGWYNGDTKVEIADTDGSDGWALTADEAKGALSKGGDLYADTTFTARFVVDFSDFSVAEDEWAYNGSSRQIQVDGVYAGDKLTYTSSNGEVLATCDVTADGIVNAPEFLNVSDSDTVSVTVTRGGKTASDDATMTITPLTIMVTPHDIRKTQGQADPALTSDYNGYLRGETAGWTGALTREPGEAVGTYTISQGSLQLADNPAGNFLAQNYILVVNEGTFTIVAAPVPPDGGTDNPGGGTGGTNPGGTGTGAGTGTGTGAGTNPAPTPVTATADDDAAADDEAINDDENPLADDASADDESDDAESIDDDSNPLASGTGSTAETCWVHWAVIVGIIVTVAYFAVCAARTRRATNELASFEDDVLDRR